MQGLYRKEPAGLHGKLSRLYRQGTTPPQRAFGRDLRAFLQAARQYPYARLKARDRSL